VDDKWITIGSANIDKNGFKDSTEVNVGITSSSLAKQLRTRLWTEHTGLLENTMDMTNEMAKRTTTSRRKLIPSPYDNGSNIDDFDNGFNIWKKTADHNGLAVSNKGNITGHIYYYNFDEMNLPPPYPDAKGGSKFSFL
jgi:phosphatidylserine/phosphatidylglycerophosphate/cardiolipin synthase-like enzyme